MSVGASPAGSIATSAPGALALGQGPRRPRRERTRRSTGAGGRRHGAAEDETGRLSAENRCFSSLLPLWEKVARTKSVPDEGFASAEAIPHPSSLREATLSHKGPHKGRGES